MTTLEHHYRTDSAVADTPTEGYRIDRARFDLSAPKKVEGGWEVEGYAAAPGILTYKDPDGRLRRELVTAKTFEPVDTILGKSVTLHHPAAGRVDAANEGKVKIGEVRAAEVEANTGRLFVRFFVTDAALTEAKRKGLTGLSPGYDVKLGKGGVHPEFGAYDLEQIGRTYNHLALCGGLTDPARGGKDASFRVDSDLSPADVAAHTSREHTMRHLLTLALALGIATRNDAEGNEDALAVDIKAGIDALKTERDTAKAEADTLRADALTAEQVEAARLEWFNSRVSIVDVAKRFRVDAIETLDNDALRKAVALKAYPDADAASSVDYFRAMYDTARAKRTDSTAPATVPAARFHVDSDDKPLPCIDSASRQSSARK